ncbi:MAG: diacylglycerol kinase family protein [Acidimicrobiales bacterium]
MRASVVVNCAAGAVDGAAVGEQRREILVALASDGVDADIEFVVGSALADAVVRAIGQKPDVVVVAGGDGTLGTAAKELADSDVPLGILPLGTFNHFAKDLGIPIDLTGAASVIGRGNVRRVDVVDVGDRCFVNNSSVGVYPIMVALRDEIGQERGWGKVRSMPIAVGHVLRRFPVRRLTITAGTYQARLRTPFVFVGNNRYEIGPRGIGTRTAVDSGELCLYVAEASTRARLVWVALKAVLRGSASVEDLHESRATEVTIDARHHRLQVALDGEVATLRSPLLYRIRPGVLSVLAPVPAVEPHTRTDPAGADATPDGACPLGAEPIGEATRRATRLCGAAALARDGWTYPLSLLEHGGGQVLRRMGAQRRTSVLGRVVVDLDPTTDVGHAAPDRPAEAYALGNPGEVEPPPSSFTETNTSSSVGST